MKTYTKKEVKKLTIKSFIATSKLLNTNIIISAYLKSNALLAMQKYDQSIQRLSKTKLTAGQNVDEIVQISENEYQIKMRE